MRTTERRSRLGTVVAGLTLLGQTAWAQTFGPPSALDSGAPSDLAEESRPRLVTDGSVWVAAWTTRNGTLGADRDVLFARSTDGGVSWSPPIALNPGAAADAGDDQLGDLVTDGAGTWVASWSEEGTAVTARSIDGGTTWSTPVPVNPNAATNQRPASNARLAIGGGMLVAAWIVPNGPAFPYPPLVVARSSDGGITWTEPVDIARNGYSASVQDLVTDGSVWLLVWTTFNSDTVPGVADGEALFVRSTDAGATWSPPAALRTDWTADAAYEDSVQLATDGTGTWLAVFAANESTDVTGSNRDFEALFARSVDGGLTWSAPGYLEAGFSGETGDDFSPDVATDGKGTWLATWTENGDPDRGLLLVRSTDRGVTWSEPMELDPGTAFTREKASTPSIATDKNGTWVIVWTTATLGQGVDEDDVVVFARAAPAGGGGGGPGECRIARCVLDAVVQGAACGGGTIPKKIRRALERAFAKLMVLETKSLSPKKLEKQRFAALKRVRRAADAAQRATRGRRPKLSSACAAAIRDLADALSTGRCPQCAVATSTLPPVSTMVAGAPAATSTTVSSSEDRANPVDSLSPGLAGPVVRMSLARRL